MKKILLVTLEFPPSVGGIASYVRDMAEALPAEQLILLAPPAADSESYPYRVIRKKMFWRFAWPHWIPLAWAVIRLVKKEKIDIIFIHHILPAGYATVIAKFILRVPFILFSHGTDIAAASRNPWKRRMARLICGKSEHIIVNSESLKRRFIIRFGEYSGKTSVLYPCPNSVFFQEPNPQEIRNITEHLAIGGRHVILSIARMVDGKGFPHLVSVIKDVADKIPNLAWLIIGTGPKLAEIIELVQKNSLQNIVRFIGEVPHNKLPPYYYAADVFSLLTHPDNGMEEGLGLVFLEAAASGLPCVAGKSGGVEEAVIDRETGFVFDVYRQKAEIVAAFVSLLSDENLSRGMGSRAAGRIRSEFNWEKQLAVLGLWIR